MIKISDLYFFDVCMIATAKATSQISNIVGDAITAASVTEMEATIRYPASVANTLNLRLELL